MIKRIHFLIAVLLFSFPFLSSGQNIDTLAFEKKVTLLQKELNKPITNELRFDSLQTSLNNYVIDFFSNPETYNYSFKILKEHYNFIASDKIRLLSVEYIEKPLPVFRHIITVIQYKGDSGKANVVTIDGAGSDEVLDNLYYYEIFKVDPKQNIYLTLNRGKLCHSCIADVARVFQIKGDQLVVDYPAFNGKAFFTTATRDFAKFGFKYDPAKKTLFYEYTFSDFASENENEHVEKGQFYFNGTRFIKK